MSRIKEIFSPIKNLFGDFGKNTGEILKHLTSAAVAEVAINRIMPEEKKSSSASVAGKNGATGVEKMVDAVGIGLDPTGKRNALQFLLDTKIDGNFLILFNEKYDRYKKKGKENKFMSIMADAIERAPENQRLEYLKKILLKDKKDFNRFMNGLDNDPVAEKARHVAKKATKALGELEKGILGKRTFADV